ncbi:MAG TPA: NAD(P)-dependent oxidoreductase [Solirubrobacteraceae bacterium]|nr:NAD(P)-dependent oxidoreductase [Solirubrobacteraceae bacterium]
MRILVAGASGAIGRQLLPLLDAVGHETIGLVHRTPVEVRNGHLVTADALDRDALTTAVSEFEPEVVVNLLTAIPHNLNPRTFERQFAQTNRLRTEGTANLVAATRGVRMISESVAFAYAPRPGLVADETAPLWERGPKAFLPALAALQELERITAETGGVCLRFGSLVGPGTGFAPDGTIVEAVRGGKLPIVGDGSGTFSFIHTHDAATAIVAALDRPEVTGALNIVDDQPLRTAEWLPALARLIGARSPRRLPQWLARLVAGSWGVAFLNGLVGATNARAKAQLDWRPRYARVQEAWQADLGGVTRPSVAV